MSSGLLDTNVVVDLVRLDPDELPDEQSITTVTIGELSVGPLIAADQRERARRQAFLQEIEHRFANSTLVYDLGAARVFGGVMASALARGRSSRRRTSDFQIAAIAIANRLPLYTSNVIDFEDIDGLDVRSVTPRTRGPAGEA